MTGFSHPSDSMIFISPSMAVSLLPLALGLEAEHLAHSPEVWSLATLFWICIGSFLAFALTLSEFLIVSKTNR